MPAHRARARWVRARERARSQNVLACPVSQLGTALAGALWPSRGTGLCGRHVARHGVLGGCSRRPFLRAEMPLGTKREDEDEEKKREEKKRGLWLCVSVTVTPGTQRDSRGLQVRACSPWPALRTVLRRCRVGGVQQRHPLRDDRNLGRDGRHGAGILDLGC